MYIDYIIYIYYIVYIKIKIIKRENKFINKLSHHLLRVIRSGEFEII